jgi:2-keto-4-pentenoate hydratase/2-oxohepta-3-ene-1,7-dioic acid hydratase in catechol pathway
MWGTNVERDRDGFALGTFSRVDGERFVGLVRDDRVVAVGGPLAVATVLDLVTRWDEALEELRRLADAADFATATPTDALRVHAPVDLPRQMFFTGANYRKHVIDLTIDQGAGPEGLSGEELRRWAEDMMDERAAHGVPYSFLKPPSSVIGAYDDLVLPATTAKPDWELELGVIIGRGGRNISRAEAMAHVAGYAIVNDVSARDLIPRTDYTLLGTDWLRGKGQPGFCPFGPVLVPAAFVPDPHDLRVLLTLNGTPMQDETTADMIFDIPRQIEYVSKYAELWPGDLISTGSPAGNGTHYGRFLRDGDVMEASITGLGRQRNRCIGPSTGP